MEGSDEQSLCVADGSNPAPVEVGSLSHSSQGLMHPRWCKKNLPGTVPQNYLSTKRMSMLGGNCI